MYVPAGQGMPPEIAVDVGQKWPGEQVPWLTFIAEVAVARHH